MPAAAGDGGATEEAIAPQAQSSVLDGATLIDSTVAILDHRMITLSYLDQEARVMFIEHAAIEDASAPLDLAKRRAALSYLLNEMLLENEAARLQVFEVSDRESAEQQKQLQSRFPSAAAFHAFLARFDISPEALDQSVRRSLRAERYLADRLRLLDNSGKPDARANVSTQVEGILQEIRTRHDVRVLTDFVAESVAPGAQVNAPLKIDAGPGRPSAWGQVR
jgi:hypothetical protein